MEMSGWVNYGNNLLKLFELFDESLHHLLGVAKDHHGVLHFEEAILDAGVARAQASFDDKNSA